MSKLLFWLLLALGAFLLFKGLKRPGRHDVAKAAKGSGERMVTCAHCGVHLPQSDSIESAGQYYCSEEHRRLGA